MRCALVCHLRHIVLVPKLVAIIKTVVKRVATKRTEIRVARVLFFLLVLRSSFGKMNCLHILYQVVHILQQDSQNVVKRHNYQLCFF